MKRREFVKAAAVAAVTTVTTTAASLGQQTPAPATAPPEAPTRGRGGNQATPPPTSPATVADLVAAGDPHFFNHQQFATLRRLCELMMPALNGYPSAVEAGAPEFLDFLVGATPAGRQQSYFATIAGAAPARQVVTGSIDRRQMYVTGLERLENEAQKRFLKSFAALGPDQADVLLAPALAPWMADHPPRDSFQRFINVVHQDIRTATMNSAAWNAAATAAGERAPGVGSYWKPIDPRIERRT
ncbi:MAG TPA: gluconate 2-dehydrogenase subunit 3 family protein [Terracidiphilus sp.]